MCWDCDWPGISTWTKGRGDRLSDCAEAGLSVRDGASSSSAGPDAAGGRWAATVCLVAEGRAAYRGIEPRCMESRNNKSTRSHRKSQPCIANFPPLPPSPHPAPARCQRLVVQANTRMPEPCTSELQSPLPFPTHACPPSSPSASRSSTSSHASPCAVECARAHTRTQAPGGPTGVPGRRRSRRPRRRQRARDAALCRWRCFCGPATAG